MYIDTHSHLNYENKYGDTDKLLAEIAAAGIENPQVKVVYLSLLAFRQARTCLGPVGCRTHADVYRRGHAFRDTAAPKQLLVRTAGKNGQ